MTSNERGAYNRAVCPGVRGQGRLVVHIDAWLSTRLESTMMLYTCGVFKGTSNCLAEFQNPLKLTFPNFPELYLLYKEYITRNKYKFAM